MTRNEANELADIVRQDRKSASAHQLGNQEWIVKLENPVYFLWSMQDYVEFQEAQEDKSKRKATGLAAAI